LKILLDLDLDILPRQRAAQRVAVVADSSDTQERNSLTSAIRRRPRYGRGPNVAWPGEFRKGRATPVVLMGIRPQCPFKGGLPSFCRDNAAVLNLADACLSPTVAAMRLFYGREAVHARPGRRVIVFTGAVRRRWPILGPSEWPRSGEFASRPTTTNGIIQHCLAQMIFYVIQNELR
jgi:hypothetical protein